MRSFNALSTLLAATTVVQAVNIADGDDYVCTGSTEDSESECYGALLDVASGSAFSLKCQDISSCRNSHIVVHSGCTLKAGGIDCSPQFACRDAEIVVYSSDLATHSNRFLNCFHSGSIGGLCKDMNMTLVDSSIMLYCGSNDCDYMKVYLFGSSTLELKKESVMAATLSNALTIYMSEDSTLIDNDITGYNLVSITDPPTTSTTLPSTSTTLLPPTTTTMTPTSTTETPTSTTKTPTTTLITSTTKFTTQLTTFTILGSTETTDGNGDGGGNPPIVIYGAVAGAVFVVVLVVVAICCRRKRGKSKSDGHQQIPATAAPAKADSIEESREVVTYIQSDNEDENPEEKNDMLVTAGGPSVASDVDLEESSVSSILSEGQVPTRA